MSGNKRHSLQQEPTPYYKTQNEETMKQENREYYNYWGPVNIRVGIEFYPDMESETDPEEESNVLVAFYETDQPANEKTHTYATIEEAKAYAVTALAQLRVNLLASLDKAEQDVPLITENSKNFIGYNPDGGW